MEVFLSPTGDLVPGKFSAIADTAADFSIVGTGFAKATLRHVVHQPSQRNAIPDLFSLSNKLLAVQGVIFLGVTFGAKHFKSVRFVVVDNLPQSCTSIYNWK